ncbi:hypothetical protein THIOM_003056 [Candidatus Thiomargarita nelsonii]|uniref:Uncharacterized protein n=1 Tax=Candidatus Thiomargarita nelsonii TaxID=1003181 RepID=A0A176RZF4_9GAMM|nr:hypothetical protein THIOM_003056 [Candidatus Thiomargarita nelsonii]
MPKFFQDHFEHFVRRCCKHQKHSDFWPLVFAPSSRTFKKRFDFCLMLKYYLYT